MSGIHVHVMQIDTIHTKKKEVSNSLTHRVPTKLPLSV
jgi:hypothetical protein